MKTFPELFNAILIEDKDESRKAAREVRKLLYGAHDGCNYEDIAYIVANAPEEYAKITEGWRQENFVMAVSVLYYLHDKEAQPDFLFPWLFDLLQDENGYIRHAAVRMIENELGPLTVHIRFPREKSSFIKLLPERADYILFTLFLSLNILATDLWKPAYKRYKYIASLPSGSYKSVQMILAHLEDACGREYMTRLTRLCELPSNDKRLDH